MTDIVERLSPTEEEVNQRCDEWDGWGFYEAVEEVLERENQVAAQAATITTLRAKVTALREGLERIATVDMGGGFLSAQACRTVARRALLETNHAKESGL